MTEAALDEIERIPREDWDFSVMHDALLETVAEVRRLREANERLNREAAAIHDSERHWIQRNNQTNEELIRVRSIIAAVLADAESQHPGGWGPDVTTVGILRQALEEEPVKNAE